MSELLQGTTATITAERVRRAGPTAPCKQYQVIGGRPGNGSSIHKQSLVNVLCEYVVRHASHWLEARTRMHERMHACMHACTHTSLLVVRGFADGEVEWNPSVIVEIKYTRRSWHQDGHVDAEFTARDDLGMVIIKSLDTYILGLTAYYATKMTNTVNMWIETGTITSTTGNCRFGPLYCFYQDAHQFPLCLELEKKVSMSSHETKLQIGFPLEPGWEIMNGKLVNVFIKGSMVSELLEASICSCLSRSRCTINCSSNQNSVYCTELCTCLSNENSTFNWWPRCWHDDDTHNYNE